MEGNTNGAFAIDKTTGAMTLASQLGINYEELTPNPIIVKVKWKWLLLTCSFRDVSHLIVCQYIIIIIIVQF